MPAVTCPEHSPLPNPRAYDTGTTGHASKLTDDDHAVHEEIPVTSVARVLLDQAARIDERRLRKLPRRAGRRLWQLGE